MRRAVAIVVAAFCALAALPFANPNFHVRNNGSGYSTYREWASPNDDSGQHLNDGWRADDQTILEVYQTALRAGRSDLLRALISPANALTPGQKAVLFSGIPSWVLRGGGIPANVDLNFATGQYYGCSPASCLAITRASNATDLVPSSASGYVYNTYGPNVLAISPGFGLYIFEARTNLLLNSTAPATQTTGSLANGTYTLWVNGSGTATMSAGTATGCGTGVASQGTPVNFTTSGTVGTCTVTVGGSLNAFQLELGAFGTSFIVTAGAAATRAADNITFSGSLLSVMQGATGSFIAAMGAFPNVAAFPEIWNTSASVKLEVSGSNTSVVIQDASGGLTNSSALFSAPSKTGHSWNASGRSISSHGSNAATDALATSARTTINAGSRAGSVQFANTVFSRETAWNTRILDTALKAGTQ